MKNLIYIENENLADYIMFSLDKIDNGFTEEELDKITEVLLDFESEKEKSITFLEDFSKLKNLKSITLRNGHIFNKIYNIFLNLRKLDELVFENCRFENPNLIASLELKSLSFYNCRIESYLFINLIKTLEELTIIKGKISIDNINLLKNLKYLRLSSSTILDNGDLNINNIKELYVDDTNLDNFSFLTNLSNLKKLIIDEKQYINNKKLFSKLSNNNLLILNNNDIRFNISERDV